MTENTLNIFDLLQGSPNKAAAGQLGLLESLGQTDVLNLEQQEMSFDMIFGNMLASASSGQFGQQETAVQNSLTQENQALLQMFPQQTEAVNIFDKYTIAPQGEMMEQAEAAKNIQAFNKELNELIPQNKLVQNINIKEILAQQNHELENGQFKVLSKEIVDSKVALTIENTNGKQLTISLPVESLQNSNSNGMQQRVSLQDSYYQKELESLIEKVDIKQIEIKSADAKISQSALKPVEISLLGEQNSAVVTLKASLKKNQINITDNTTVTNQKAAVLDESRVWDEKVIVNTNQSNKLIEPVSSQLKQQVLQTSLNGEQQFQMKDNITNQSTERSDSIFNLYKSDAIETAGTKENIQNVRMQLPENIKSVLRPNGQAVIIKMNPENLGPAKLSLSFSGGKLRAKLVVSSVNAKQVLDGSMNRLVDQLQKADIVVDKIEVTLDENRNQNEQFNQKQQWQRKMSHKNIDLEQFEQNELEQSVQKPMLSALQPILSGSVNFLA